MSTICKLDPTVRATRSSRRASIRGLRDATQRIHGMNRVMAEITLAELTMIKECPSLTGAQKMRAFGKVVSRLLSKPSHAYPAASAA